MLISEILWLPFLPDLPLIFALLTSTQGIKNVFLNLRITKQIWFAKIFRVSQQNILTPVMNLRHTYVYIHFIKLSQCHILRIESFYFTLNFVSDSWCRNTKLLAKTGSCFKKVEKDCVQQFWRDLQP